MALAVAAGRVLTAYRMTVHGDTTPSLHSAAAPMTCTGTAPKVRTPQATVGNASAVQAEVADAIEAVVALGIAEPPGTVTVP